MNKINTNTDITETNDFDDIRIPKTTFNDEKQKLINLQNVKRKKMNTIIKVIMFIICMLFIFPFACCDLYFGYEDTSCVNEPAGKLSINLKDYLVVCGWCQITTLAIINIVLCFCDIDPNINKYDTNDVIIYLVSRTIYILYSLFIISWNIVGSIIFWSLMDTSNCSNSIYNYVFASLIIKIIFCSYGLLSGHKTNNE